MKYNISSGSLVLRRDITEKGTKEWLCKVVESDKVFEQFLVYPMHTKIKTFGFLKKFIKLAYSWNYPFNKESSKVYAICINKRLLQEFGFKPSKTRTDTMEYDSKKWKISVYCVYDTTPENVNKNKFLLIVYTKNNSIMLEKSWCRVKYMHDIQAILRTIGCNCPKRLVRYTESNEE